MVTGRTSGLRSAHDPARKFSFPGHHSVDRIFGLLARWSSQDSCHAATRILRFALHSSAGRDGRLRSAFPQLIWNWVSGKSSIPAQPHGPDYRHGFYLDGNRAGDLGALPPGGVLERAGHNQRGRPQAHPHWPICAPAPSNLYRLILATIGSAIVINRWRCAVGVCLVASGYCFKAKKEESMLTQQFGDAFGEHQKHTGFLIPRFR
jgi:hypothetical protein